VRVPAELGPRRLKAVRAFLQVAALLVMATVTAAVMADEFGPVHYDPKSDQLIVTIIYVGTNPDHHFSIQWGQCRNLDEPGHPGEPGVPPHEIIVSILDDQGNDAARTSYTKIVRVPLATLSCRPAKVTLWTTPAFFGRDGRPGARASLDIP
jgi:hypothetical protein